MRILIVSQWFEPEPTLKGFMFAKALAARGHKVQVLTGFPNYPDGKLYPGYAVRPFRREVVDGIKIVRVALFPSHDLSSFRRILNYLSFSISAALLGPLLISRADVAYIYHPPATVVLPALALKFFRLIPYVLDVQDLWPDTLRVTGMVRSRFMLWVSGIMCRVMYAGAAKVVVLSPGIKTVLMERSVPENKIEVIYNWCDETNMSDVPHDYELEESLDMRGRFNVIYAGNIGRVQSLDSVLEAALILGNLKSNVLFSFVGSGIEQERLIQTALGHELNNVRFLPRVPFSEVARILILADALLVHIKDDPLFEITVPSKIQAYLAIGRPIIAAVKGDGADLIKRAEAGVTCNPCMPELLVDCILSMMDKSPAERDEIGKHGKQYYFLNLALAMGVKRFEDVFYSIASPIR